MQVPENSAQFAAVAPPQRKPATTAPATGPVALADAVVPSFTQPAFAPPFVPPVAAPTLRPPPAGNAAAAARAFEPVTALFVIYDADGTPAGELIYMTKKLLGLGHCAACDITHGPRREKPEFTQLKAAGWSVPLTNIHRDEMDAALAGAVGARLPCVAARTATRDVVLFGQEALVTCEGDVLRFQGLVDLALRVHRLSAASPAGLRRQNVAAAPQQPFLDACAVPSAGIGANMWERRAGVPQNAQRDDLDAVVPGGNT